MRQYRRGRKSLQINLISKPKPYVPRDYEIDFISPQLYDTLTNYLLIIFFSISVQFLLRISLGSKWIKSPLLLLFGCCQKLSSREGVGCTNPLEKLLSGPSYKPWLCNCQPRDAPKDLHLSGDPLYLQCQGQMSKWRGSNSGTIRKRNQNPGAGWNTLKPRVTAFPL